MNLSGRSGIPMLASWLRLHKRSASGEAWPHAAFLGPVLSLTAQSLEKARLPTLRLTCAFWRPPDQKEAPDPRPHTPRRSSSELKRRSGNPLFNSAVSFECTPLPLYFESVPVRWRTLDHDRSNRSDSESPHQGQAGSVCSPSVRRRNCLLSRRVGAESRGQGLSDDGSTWPPAANRNYIGPSLAGAPTIRLTQNPQLTTYLDLVAAECHDRQAGSAATNPLMSSSLITLVTPGLASRVAPAHCTRR